MTLMVPPPFLREREREREMREGRVEGDFIVHKAN